MKARVIIASLVLCAVVGMAQAVAPEVEITAEPHHHLVFENAYLRVFYVDVPPHDATSMHWHRHDYIFVTLGATDVSNEVKDKPPVELKLQDGEARFAPASFAHIARNLSAQPFRNVTIELLSENGHAAWNTGFKWDEDRGLDVLHGGTKQIVFVQDGVRVAEIELQPGATLPKHHHTGPHLLVAVSDLDVRSDVEGKGPMPGHFKSGEAKWLPGGYSHTLTNVGEQAARFVTLEFP